MIYDIYDIENTFIEQYQYYKHLQSLINEDIKIIEDKYNMKIRPVKYDDMCSVLLNYCNVNGYYNVNDEYYYEKVIPKFLKNCRENISANIKKQFNIIN